MAVYLFDGDHQRSKGVEQMPINHSEMMYVAMYVAMYSKPQKTKHHLWPEVGVRLPATQLHPRRRLAGGCEIDWNVVFIHCHANKWDKIAHDFSL